MNSTDNKKLVLYIFAAVIALAFMAWFVLFGFDSIFSSTANNLLNQKTFNGITPGTSTATDLENKYGTPSGKEKSSGGDLNFYDSAEKYQYEYAWTKDGKVIATKERAKNPVEESAFMRTLGDPDLILYDTTSESTWLIYLNKGIAGQLIGSQVYALLRFSPQTEAEFMSNVADTVGMSKNPPPKDNVAD